jgi:hypothetical protein
VSVGQPSNNLSISWFRVRVRGGSLKFKFIEFFVLTSNRDKELAAKAKNSERSRQRTGREAVGRTWIKCLGTSCASSLEQASAWKWWGRAYSETSDFQSAVLGQRVKSDLGSSGLAAWKSEGQRRQSALQGNGNGHVRARQSLEIAPNLCARVGLVRHSAGTALVAIRKLSPAACVSTPSARHTAATRLARVGPRSPVWARGGTH